MNAERDLYSEFDDIRVGVTHKGVSIEVLPSGSYLARVVAIHEFFVALDRLIEDVAEEVFVATTAAIAGVVPGSRCHLSGVLKLHDIPAFDVGNMSDDAARKVHLLDELNHLLGQLKVVLEYLVKND